MMRGWVIKQLKKYWKKFLLVLFALADALGICLMTTNRYSQRIQEGMVYVAISIVSAIIAGHFLWTPNTKETAAERWIKVCLTVMPTIMAALLIGLVPYKQSLSFPVSIAYNKQTHQIKFLSNMISIATPELLWQEAGIDKRIPLDVWQGKGNRILRNLLVESIVRSMRQWYWQHWYVDVTRMDFPDETTFQSRIINPTLPSNKISLRQINNLMAHNPVHIDKAMFFFENEMYLPPGAAFLVKESSETGSYIEIKNLFCDLKINLETMPSSGIGEQLSFLLGIPPQPELKSDFLVYNIRVSEEVTFPSWLSGHKLAAAHKEWATILMNTLRDNYSWDNYYHAEVNKGLINHLEKRNTLISMKRG